MDPRFEKAQHLFQEVQELRKKGQASATLPKLREMARLHQERALELLSDHNLDGWIDLFAAITAWGEAGQRKEADLLLQAGREHAANWTEGRQNLETELDQQESWLDSLQGTPPRIGTAHG